MDLKDTQRIEELEWVTAGLTARLERLEGGRAAAEPDRLPVVPAPRATAPPRGVATARRRHPAVSAPPPGLSLEDLVGGRLLALAGGVAVLAGIVCFFGLAISRGWLDETARTLLGVAFGAALVAAGARLRRGRGASHPQAALALTGTGVGVLFLATAIATQGYALVGPVPGTLLALTVGALATVLAVRWDAPPIGALGLLGGLLAPALTAGRTDDATLALLLAAGAAAAAVLVWQDWRWLGPAAFVVLLPQWGFWIAETEGDVVRILVALVAFGLLTAAMATGLELRRADPVLRSSSAGLLVCGAVASAVAGWLALGGPDHDGAAIVWLAALAAAHVAAAGLLHRSARASHALTLIAATLGVVLADAAFALVADGIALPLGWAAGAVGFAALRRAITTRADDRRALELGLGGHVALALLHALTALDSADAATAAVPLAALAAACLSSARLVTDRRSLVRAETLDILGLAALATVGFLLADPARLPLIWAAEATALAAIARRTGDRVAAAGALMHLAGALLVCLAVLAPPVALLEGLDDAAAALLALGATAGAAAWCAARGLGAGPAGLTPAARPWLAGGAALGVLYAASCLLVDASLPASAQQGQMWLSALWGSCGVAGILFGLRADLPPVRHAALVLLATAGAKALLYDLATLDSGYRVASLVGLGLLLLAGGHAWQRMRPAAPPQR